MKIALLFLLCFVSATWQQNIYWSYPPGRVPFYSLFDKNLQVNLPILISSDPTEVQYSKRYGYRRLEQDDVIEQPTPERSLGSNIYQRMKTNLQPKTFGFNNYLASLILNSLTTTTTSVTTFTSVITAATVVTCFTKAMFLDAVPTACRRKRDADSSLLIGHNYDEYLNIPFSSENSAATGAFELPKEGRDIDPAQWVASSQNEKEADVYESIQKQTESSVDRYIRQNRNFVNSVKVTSTLTTYSVSYSTITSTVKNLVDYANADPALQSFLLCLPSGLTICP